MNLYIPQLQFVFAGSMQPIEKGRIGKWQLKRQPRRHPPRRPRRKPQRRSSGRNNQKGNTLGGASSAPEVFLRIMSQSLAEREEQGLSIFAGVLVRYGGRSRSTIKERNA